MAIRENLINRLSEIYQKSQPLIRFFSSNFTNSIVSLISALMVIVAASATGIGIPLAIGYAVLTVAANIFVVAKDFYRQMDHRSIDNQALKIAKNLKNLEVKNLKKSFLNEAMKDTEIVRLAGINDSLNSVNKIEQFTSKIFINLPKIEKSQHKCIANILTKKITSFKSESQAWKRFKVIAWGIGDVAKILIDWIPMLNITDPLRISLRAFSSVRGISSSISDNSYNFNQIVSKTKIVTDLEDLNSPNNNELGDVSENFQALLDKRMIKRFYKHKAANDLPTFFSNIGKIQENVIEKTQNEIWKSQSSYQIEDFVRTAKSFVGYKTIITAQELEKKVTKIINQPGDAVTQEKYYQEKLAKQRQGKSPSKGLNIT